MTAWLTRLQVVVWGGTVLSILVVILLAATVVWAIFLIIRGIVRMVRKMSSRRELL